MDDGLTCGWGRLALSRRCLEYHNSQLSVQVSPLPESTPPRHGRTGAMSLRSGTSVSEPVVWYEDLVDLHSSRF